MGEMTSKEKGVIRKSGEGNLGKTMLMCMVVYV